MVGNKKLLVEPHGLKPVAPSPKQKTICHAFIHGLKPLEFLRRGLIAGFFLIGSLAHAAGEKTLSGLNLQDFENKKEGEIVWSNNPFVRPAGEITLDEMKLTGIAYSVEGSAAIVNDQIVRKGDKIGSNEVVGIEKNKVIIRNEDGLFSLMFQGGK